jgi:hypothetical protein
MLSGAPFSGAESLASRLGGHHISLPTLCLNIDSLDGIPDPFIRYGLPASKDAELLAKHASNDAKKSASSSIVISGSTDQQQIDAIYNALATKNTTKNSIYINPSLPTSYKNYTNTWGRYRTPNEILGEIHHGQSLAAKLGLDKIAEHTSYTFTQDYRSVACGAILLRTELTDIGVLPLAN